MCKICDDFKKGNIDAKIAFVRISDALQDQSDSEKTGHLIELSATILDKDVPMSEVDEKAEEEWQKNYKQEE
jgi:hypothetical protein